MDHETTGKGSGEAPGKTVYFYTYPPTIHSMFKPLLQHPPEGYRFVTDKKMTTPLYALNKVSTVQRLNERVLKRLVNTTILKDHLYRFRSLPKTDLIYSTGYLVLKRRPWVVELGEVVTSVTGYDEPRFRKRLATIKEVLERPECRHIMPNNAYIKGQVADLFKSPIIDAKTSIVYNAISTEKADRMLEGRPRAPRDTITLIFVGSSNIGGTKPFLLKGGHIAIGLFEQMAKRDRRLRLVIVSHLDDGTKARIARTPGITHYESLPQERLFEQYLAADWYLAPCFGIPITSGLEAMAFRLPIITLDAYYNAEYLKHGEEGILLRPPQIPFEREDHMTMYDGGERLRLFAQLIGIVDEEYLKARAADLLPMLTEENRARMSAGAYRLVKSGKFSIAHRNRALKRIFDEATR